MTHAWVETQVHCAVEHALLLRCTLEETATSLEATGIAPAVFTRLGEAFKDWHALRTLHCTAGPHKQQQLPCLHEQSEVPPSVSRCPDRTQLSSSSTIVSAVWKQLEEQNPSFFQEYYKALAAQVT